MPIRIHLILIVLLATLFVPVPLNFGVIDFVVPLAWGHASAFRALIKGKGRQALGFLMYGSIYTGMFYLAAILAAALLAKIPSFRVRLVLQIATLIAIFSCSFSRQITYSSLQGRGGVYTFWEAAARLHEKNK